MSIGFDGERTSIIFDNRKSALDHPYIIMEYLANEVAAGCKAGPFTQPPFSDFVGLPMDIVAKIHSFPVKYRIIHDLSWPPQDSINSHIDPAAFRCFYGSFNDMVALIIKNGVGAMSAKLDLVDAFKYILVRNQGWALLGSSWDLQQPDRSMVCLYYVDLFLPFGLCSSPVLFSEHADALQHAMQINKVQDLLHYMDYYFTVGPPDSLVCANNIITMIATCKELGFTINYEKVTKVDIDSITKEARIDHSCLSETILLLEDILGWCSATKWTILLLVGKLHFVCFICRPGRAFLHCVIEASMKAQDLYHRIKLNEEFCWDIDWWLQYLPTWNGASLLYESHWLTSMECKLFTDASNVGFGCYYQGHRCQGKFPETCFRDELMSIKWRELYGVTMVLAIWVHHSRGKSILVHCDNSSVV